MSSEMVYAAKEPLESRTVFYSAIQSLLQEVGKPTKNFRIVNFNIDALPLASIVTRGEFWKHMKGISLLSSLQWDQFTDSSSERLRRAGLGQIRGYTSLSQTGSTIGRVKGSYP